MRKHELKICPKCKKKIFVILTDERGELVEIQYIGIRRISERTVNRENKNFICALCEKPQKPSGKSTIKSRKTPTKKSKTKKKVS